MDKRKMLIDAALSVIEEKGYANMSLRDVAKTAAVSLSSIHYHFDDKDELLIEVVKSFKITFLQELGQIVTTASRDHIHDVIEFLKHSVRDRVSIHRLWYDLQVLGLYHPEVRTEIIKIRERFYQLIELLITNSLNDRPIPLGNKDIGTLVFATADGILLQAVMTESPEEVEQLFTKLEIYMHEIIGRSKQTPQ